MKKTIEDFLSSSSIRAISALSYRRDLENLARYFAFDFTAIGKKEITSYFESLSRTVSASSFSRCVSVVKSYFAYLDSKGLIRENPTNEIFAKNFSQKDPVELSREECERLITYSGPGFRGMRDQVMLLLLSETGIRVSELVGLDRKDFSKGALLCGKDRHRRVLTLSAQLSRKIEDYMILSSLYFSLPLEDDPLFITAKGTRLTRQGFWKNLKDRAIYCGIDKPISPHSLRRYFAKSLMEEGMDKEEIRQKLGNLDTASLRGYQQKQKE